LNGKSKGGLSLTLHDLKPIKSGGNCFDDIIETISQAYHRDYEMMYVESLRFGFSREDTSKSIGENLQLDFFNRFQHVGKYHGYRLQINREDSFDDFLSITREYLNRNQPICIYIDTFYVPWDPGYGRFHYFNHTVIVFGIDEQNQNLIIMDPFFQQTDRPLSVDIVRQAFQRYMTIDLLPEESRDRDAVFADVSNHLQEHMQATLNGMLEFANALPSIEFNKELEGFVGFGYTPLFLKLSSTIVGRVNYARMLIYLDQRFDEPKLADIAEEIKGFSDKWAVIRGYISKMNIMSRKGTHLSMMDNTVEKIVEAANAEYKVLKQLLDILKQAHSDLPTVRTKGRDQQAPNVTVGKIIPIALEQLCHSIGIENEDNTADFDSEGNAFARDALPENHLLNVDEMSFQFPASPSGEFDNLICQLQTIELPEDIYSGIMILGCTVTGSDMGIIIVEYEDGTNELVHFGFSNWRGYYPIDHEIIAWKSRATHRELGKSSSEVYLYAKNTVLNIHKKARCLILPEVQNMHIFAISMWK
jgi:hypothetical protein